MGTKQEKKERYSRLEDILKLALKMQSNSDGISLTDIEEFFGVSRRTAERMRDAVIGVFGQEEIETKEGKKYWKLKPRTIVSAPQILSEELAALEGGISLLKAEGRRKDAATLSALRDKVSCLVSSNRLKAIETDVEALTEAEGLATRPRPRIRIDEGIVLQLRSAILARHKVKIDYYARSRGGSGEQTVHPYGFVYGNRHYLVAWSEKDKDFRYFTLSNIKSVKVSEKFYDAKDFSLRQYSGRSFGVYQEDRYYDVVWKFSKKAAPDALEYEFHPSQVVEKQKDGSVVVSFKACGFLEMVWHLFTWGSEVEIVAPKELRVAYKKCVSQLKRY